MSTLVTFHAHPDDESLLTAGVMAKAAAEGHRVVLVVATTGDAGEVDLAFLGDEDLGRRRTRETEMSARALNVDRLVFLGYGDSGVDGALPDGFAHADVNEAATSLAAVLREEAADVVTTYDPHGGYGHADHVQAHVVGRVAAELASIPVLLEATFNRDLLKMAADLAPTLGLDLPDDFAAPDTSDWFVPATEITHTVDVGAFIASKRASMEAHASQATSASSNVRSLEMFLRLPEEWFAIAFGTEWFVDRSLEPGTAVDDIFATLDPHTD